MTDLTSLIACITLLTVTFSVLRFLRWYFKNESELCRQINDLSLSNAELRKENGELKRKAVNNDERLSDLY